MDRQNSITLLGITNFLQTGALLRQKGRWMLIAGPFEPREKPNKHEISVFCPDFYDLENSPLWVGAHVYDLSSEQVREACQAYLAKENVSSEALSSWQEPEKADFAQALQVIQERISKNEISKAVPVVFARSSEKVTPQQRAQMMIRLIDAPETLHVYGFWSGDSGVLGATPEILFSYQNQILETMALAGTCPKSESSSRESLLHDEKEMHEHHLVVEDLVNMFKGQGDLDVEGPMILELPTLYHLKTDIRVRAHSGGFSDADFISLIKKLHPTPALGVAPRKTGYKWMSALPGQDDRGRYGAPFAILSDSEALCLVGIRNLQWNKQSSMIGSGCGVVAASELEREWRELFQKRFSVKKILGLEL